MSFQLTSEQEMIRLMARDFARKELEPFAGKWDREKTFPAGAIKKMGGLGLMGMMIPAEYGGAGAGAVSYSLALQEIAYACASTAVTMSVTNLSSDPILKFGTEEQKCRYLTPLARGEMLGAFAVTEPEAGSDPGSMTTRAEERGDHYLVNGSKIFITNGSYADVIVLITRTGSEKANRGLSAFLLTRGDAGIHHRTARGEDGALRLRYGRAPLRRLSDSQGEPSGEGRDRLQDRDGCPRQRPDRDRLPVARDRPGLPRRVDTVRPDAQTVRQRASVHSRRSSG